MSNSVAVVANEPFLVLDVQVATPVVLGTSGRRFIPITGGTVSGSI